MLNFLPLLCLLFFCDSPLAAQDEQSANTNKDPVSVFDSDLEFHGWRGDHKNSADFDEIRIGLFLPEDPTNKSKISIHRAADMAIKEINASGGYNGVPYRLVRRWSNDPWRAGSKEMIKLVYQDSVWAVIGSLNGDATHIAEQIATKAFLPLIAPVSADPTLNYIRIPWIFRLAPDYKSQAALIVRESLKKHALHKVGLISTTTHDGRIFSKEIKDALQKFNHSLVFHFQISSQSSDFPDIIERALSFQSDGLIIFLSNNAIENIIIALKNKSFSKPLFIPWVPGLNHELFNANTNKNVFFVEPFALSDNPGWDMFVQRYKQNFTYNPSMEAVLIYDAIYLLVHAIEKAGLNRAAIRDAIVNTDYVSPVTGKISWDTVGGNLIQPVLRKMK